MQTFGGHFNEYKTSFIKFAPSYDDRNNVNSYLSYCSNLDILNTNLDFFPYLRRGPNMQLNGI